jgi:sterol desaturase/sphingolipid hydroxylase (fatty acid hydroxylase superfamily)
MMQPWRLTKFGYYLDFGVYPLLIVALAVIDYAYAGDTVAWLRWVATGFIAWTLIEYWLHRLVFHGARSAIAKMHLQHHANPGAFYGVPTWYSLIFFLASSLPVLGFLGLERGIAAMIGLLVGYTLYIGVHDAVHHPSSYLHPLFSRLTIRHLRHHFQNGDAGFGVTSDFWDRVFGTRG